MTKEFSSKLKRVKYSQCEYVLNIAINVHSMTPNHNDILVASTYLKHPSIRSHLKLSDSQLEELDKLIGSILNILSSYDFILIRHRQSHKSYSYYILFVPTDSVGDTWPYPARIQFEVREHVRNDNKQDGWINSQLYIQSFDIGDKTCLNTSGVLSEVKKICKELKDGDYSSLEPYPYTEET